MKTCHGPASCLEENLRWLFCHLHHHFDPFSFFKSCLCQFHDFYLEKDHSITFSFTCLFKYIWHKISFPPLTSSLSYVTITVAPSLHFSCSPCLEFQPGSHFQTEANVTCLWLPEYPRKSVVLSSSQTLLRVPLYYVGSHSITSCPKAHSNKNCGCWGFPEAEVQIGPSFFFFFNLSKRFYLLIFWIFI